MRFQVGLVFQYPEYQLFEETVYKDIAYGPTNMGRTGDELDRCVREAAKIVGIRDDQLFKSPFELSGGQKRRVALAGVLAMEPRVLILDDFLANGKAMKGLLDVCNQAGCSVAGIGICIEKGFQPGGAELRAAGYKLASLAIVNEMSDDHLTFREQ